MGNRKRGPAPRKRSTDPNQLPLFTPESSWKPLPASEWPDFRGRAKFIGVDTETHDPRLKTHGPGFIRGDAHVCGVSLASEDGQKLYLPIAHPEDNVDPEQALKYIKHQLAGDQVKCGANLTYDLEALWSLGVEVFGPLGDIQVAEPLLDEDKEKGYSLENLALEYLGIGKTEDLLEEAAWCYNVGDNPKKGMAYIPARYVGPYAEDDAYYPVKIFEEQIKSLHADDVFKIFELERQLQRVLFKMRLRGVRIDIDGTEEKQKIVKIQEAKILDKIRQEAGRALNPASAKELGPYFEKEGLRVPRTPPSKTYPSGQHSIDDEWLKEQSHPVARLVSKWRKATKMRRDFMDKLLEDSVNGRIYSNWHQLRADKEGGGAQGTRSGRVAASKFNLTQVPSRDPYWGPMIRSLFIADEGGFWTKADYSQQEPRILLHYAYLMGFEGAAGARQRYIDDPTTDYHQMVADLVKDRSGKDIGRRPAKDINLGSAYGMGKKKLAAKLGVSKEVADEIFTAYHEGVPYVKMLESSCTDRASEMGFVKTILGRRRRFKLWEEARNFGDWGGLTLDSYEKACEEWGKHNIRRAYTRKALNAIVQGSAADQMKKALVMLDEAGLTPQIQVYDEVNGTYQNDDQVRQLKQIMETAVPMEVPFVAEPEVGRSWGETEDWKP